VPERQYKKETVLCLVVDEVPNPTEKEATHTWCSCAFVLGADARLLGEQSYGFAEVGGDGTWSGRSVY
jgi:hypothetical protein